MALKDRNISITADQWRQRAADARRGAAESWERSDTDGALSQWASGLSAREYDAWAELAENDYQAEFPALFDTDGNLLDAREVETRYGWAWLIRNPDGTISWFNPSQARKGATRLKNDKAKGYTIGTVIMDAYADLAGGSIMSVSVVVRPCPGALDNCTIGTPISSDYGWDH